MKEKLLLIFGVWFRILPYFLTRIHQVQETVVSSSFAHILNQLKG